MRINFTRSAAKAPQRRRTLIIACGVAGATVVLLGLYFYFASTATARLAKTAQAHLAQAQAAFAEQRFADSQASLQAARRDLQSARRSLNRFSAIGFVPFVHTQLTAGRNIIDGGGLIVEAAIELASIGQTVMTPFQDEQTVSLASLDVEEKAQILEAIKAAEPQLIAVQTELDQARRHLSLLPDRGLIGPLASVQEEINDKLPLLDQLIDDALPLARIIPDLAGHPAAATYLFLLQNNSELRPTGGFIGTYGVIRVHDGEIISFTTDNTYNLDAAAGLAVTPPVPLQQYIKADRWYLRDANWSPDFPTSAEKAIWFYQQEGGPVADFDGVIAITPTMIARLLAVTGPLVVEDISFTEDNFEQELYYQVSRGFLRQGIPFPDRKDIIGELGTLLLTKLLSLPQERWPILGQALLDNLNQKQLLLYSRTEAAQGLIVTQGWGGAIDTPAGDYLAIIDANMASLKSDPQVKRTVHYSLDATGEQAAATAAIEYRHIGQFDERTTRYRTYVRFYVPLASELVSVTGNDGSVEAEEELGKTVFATFMSIEPGQTETLSLTYRLPATVTDAIAAGRYDLLVQKQPGTIDHQLQLTTSFGRPIQFVSPVTATVDKKSVEVQTDFLTDQRLTVKL